MREPSDRFRLYRANINLPRMPNGSLHEIDDSDGRWKPWIDAGFISPVGEPDLIEGRANGMGDGSDAEVSSVEHVVGDEVAE